MLKGNITQISYQTAVDFLLPRHYSGRVPSITIAFGWYDLDQTLKAVITFGKPASPWLCKGVCGEEWKHNVYELNRLCRTEDWNEPLSYFVGKVLRMLKEKDWIIVSYADTAMHHNGYIYQATNFLYTGRTKKRTDIYSGKHSRHYSKQDRDNATYRIVRSAKNRYVYFCAHNKATRKAMKNSLKYPILPYPKEENKHYVLGEYQKQELVRIKKECC